jgi:hypothetical protein
MDAVTVIEQVRQAGLRIVIRGDQLGVDPVARLSGELRQHIREQRDTIVLVIKNVPGKLVHLAIVAGIHEQGSKFTTTEIRRLQGNDDLLDAINCSRAELQAWASALAIRATQRRGLVPRGWDKIARCRYCGPVWAEHDLEMLSCAWCDLRLAGKWFQRPCDNP